MFVVHFIVLKEGKVENKIEKNEEEKTGENTPAKRKVWLLVTRESSIGNKSGGWLGSISSLWSSLFGNAFLKYLGWDQENILDEKNIYK